jgi:hypothetical protein
LRRSWNRKGLADKSSSSTIPNIAFFSETSVLWARTLVVLIVVVVVVAVVFILMLADVTGLPA